MGFPTWTLVGMGVTAVLAVLMTGLAYLAQSPRSLLRLGLAAYRLDLRVKLFTGYALASLILMLGFFLAGVPLGDSATTTDSATADADSVSAESLSAESGAMSLPLTAVPTQDTPTNSSSTTENSDQTPSSGAFGGPPSGGDEIATESPSPTRTPEVVGPSPTPGADNAGTAVTPTPADSTQDTPTATAMSTATPTPLPTATPSPTITPTPIEGKTATIDTGGGTLWVRRSPGGQTLVLVRDQEVVLLENGRANQGGILWREIRTTSGLRGWVQTEFLDEGA